MRFTRVKQRDITDCGAACLASIAAFYDLKLPIALIRQYASTDKKGTNVLGLIEAANKMGFDARGVKGQLDSLFKIPKPAIAHLILDGRLQHFVVICRTHENYIEVMDPGTGSLQKIPRKEFLAIWTGVLVIMLPSQIFKPKNTRISMWSRLFALISPYKLLLIQILFGTIVYTAIGLSTSVYIQKIVDHVLVDHNQNLLNLMSIGMLILLVIQLFIGAIRSLFTLYTGQLIDSQLILGYYRHLLKLPQSFFDSMRTGEIISRINDAIKIRSFVNEALTNIAVSIFVLVFTSALMFTYYWKLALIALCIVPLYTLLYLIINKVNKKYERQIMESTAELESQLVESLNSMITIKSFNLGIFIYQKMERLFLIFLKKIYHSTINSIFTTTSSEFLSRAFTILLLWFGAGFALDNAITAGELLSFYALTGYFTGPLTNLLGSNKTIQSAVIAADRLFEIMDLEQAEISKDKIELTSNFKGNIKFKNVAFRYGSRVTVYEDLTLEISQGQITAIVGESGSGKSTLLSILQNLYPLQSGHIYIDEYDIQYISQESLNKNIGVVPQRIDLFAGNVIDNIAIGDPTPNMKKIIDLSAKIGILDFIEKLPQGFNTYLGENGATLSGGQKQRLAIARALYKDPEILILDEATSSLDSSAEHFIQKMIRLMRDQNKTVIVVAHRLSTIYQADKIVVLDQGKVAEEGNHQELYSAKGLYYRMWKNQFPIMEEEKSTYS